MDNRYLNKILGENENIIFESRQSSLILVRDILPETISIFLIGFLLVFLNRLSSMSPQINWLFILILIPTASLVKDILRWINHKYVITNRRIIQIFGVLSKNVTDSSLDKVNDVKMQQSLWGRVFNYGDIEILTASEFGINRFTRISRPIAFKTAMLNAKEASKR